jgi:hypothetical protein
MLTDIGYGTFLVFGCCCLVMSVWAYLALPETAGVALEDIRFLFEERVFVRAVQDAPGGKWLLRGRRARGVEEMRTEEEERRQERLRRTSGLSDDGKKGVVDEEELVRDARERNV